MVIYVLILSQHVTKQTVDGQEAAEGEASGWLVSQGL